jgi:hypothetical protein
MPEAWPLSLSTSREIRTNEITKQGKLTQTQNSEGSRDVWDREQKHSGCWDAEKILRLSLFLLRRWKLQVLDLWSAHQNF